MTIHGYIQADRLGRYLTSTGLQFTNLFSSDLQRAAKTASSIRHSQQKLYGESGLPGVKKLNILREQDFGYYEGKPFYARVKDARKTGKDSHRAEHMNDPDFKDVESKESMALRMDQFLNEYLIPLLKKVSKVEPTVAIVSHGIILSSLWKCILKRFEAKSVRLKPGLTIGNGDLATLEYIGGWSNTGYLEFDIQNSSLANTIDSIDAVLASTRSSQEQAKDSKTVVLHGWKMTIKAVNGKEHLKGLKRTGGGVGSSKYDESQKKIESFFVPKKAKFN